MVERRRNDFTWHKGAEAAKENGKLGQYLREHPVVMNQIEPGTYRSKNREGHLSGIVFWHEDTDGDPFHVCCEINGKSWDLTEQQRRERKSVMEPIPADERAEKLWTIFTFCIKNPIKYTLYKHFLDTGKWPDENELASDDRGGETLGQHLPDPQSYDGLVARLGKLMAEAQRVVDLGPASSKVEADQAADLKNTIVTIHKALEAGFAGEKGPLNDQLNSVRIKWTPHINAAKDHKDAINAKVITPWLAVERARAEQAARDLKEAQTKAVLDNVPIPETGRRGEAKPELPTAGNFGRKTHTREVWEVDIIDRVQFLSHVYAYPDIDEALLKIANSFRNTRPEIPGLAYRKEIKAV